MKRIVNKKGKTSRGWPLTTMLTKEDRQTPAVDEDVDKKQLEAQQMDAGNQNSSKQTLGTSERERSFFCKMKAIKSPANDTGSTISGGTPERNTERSFLFVQEQTYSNIWNISEKSLRTMKRVFGP